MSIVNDLPLVPGVIRVRVDDMERIYHGLKKEGRELSSLANKLGIEDFSSGEDALHAFQACLAAFSQVAMAANQAAVATASLRYDLNRQENGEERLLLTTGDKYQILWHMQRLYADALVTYPKRIKETARDAQSYHDALYSVMSAFRDCQLEIADVLTLLQFALVSNGREHA